MSIDHGVRVGLVAGLDALAPGAELAAALEGLSPAALTGEDLAAYVRGRWRLQNRATAELLEGIHHLGRAQDGRTERLASSDEYSGDEVSAQLGWSRPMSARKLDLADDLQQRLPEVGDALYQGWIDEPKARTLCEQTRDLVDDHAHEVCRIVLPEAPELPVGALIERIEQVATALDPDWAERRRRRAEARARVILSPNPSGTANLSFCDAPVPDGLASQARIDALAVAVRHLGVLTPIGVLRLQVGMRLLDGSTAGMDDRTIALLLAAEHHAQNTPDDPDDGSDSGSDDERARDDGTGDDGPADDGPDDEGPDDRTRRAGRAGPATHRTAPTIAGRLTTTSSRPCPRRGHRRSRASSTSPTSPTCLMLISGRSTRPNVVPGASGRASSRSGCG